MSNVDQMKSIWYLVGLMLLAMGAIVLAAGVHHLLWPPAEQTVFGELQPALWWGALMLVAGAIFAIGGRTRA